MEMGYTFVEGWRKPSFVHADKGSRAPEGHEEHSMILTQGILHRCRAIRLNSVNGKDNTTAGARVEVPNGDDGEVSEDESNCENVEMFDAGHGADDK